MVPIWGALVVLLLAVLLLIVLLVLCYRRFSRDRANLRISRDRANLDLQMISHQVQKVQTQSLTDDSASLPDNDSLPSEFRVYVEPAKRSTSLREAQAASFPPGPPSSSAGESVAEQEVTFRSGAADTVA